MRQRRPAVFRTPVGTLVLAVALMACAGCERVDESTQLEVARQHHARGDFGSAMMELKNILLRNPDSAPAYVHLAEVSLDAGQAADAEQHLRAALALGAEAAEIKRLLGRSLLAQGRFETLLQDLQGDNANVWMQRGAALLALGRLPEARTAYLRALSHPDTRATAFAGLARVASAAGDFDEATLLADEGLKADPFCTSALRALGALNLAQGYFDLAEKNFARAIESTNVRFDAEEVLLSRIGLTEAQWRAGRGSMALGNAKDLLDAYPHHPLPRYLRGLLAYDQGDYDLALDYLLEVLSALPEHPGTRLMLGRTQYARGAYADAEGYLRSYVAQAPHDTEARHLLADTYLRLDNPAMALATLRAADIEDVRTLELMGRASLHAGHPAEACAYFRQLAKVVPERGSNDFRNAYACLASGTPLAANPAGGRPGAAELLELEQLTRRPANDQAVELAKSLRQTDPANLHAMLALARLAAQRGDIERAVEWLALARTRNPDAIEPLLLMARHHERANRHAEALAVAREALQINPLHPELLVLAGDRLQELDNMDQAMANYRQALEVQPDSARAHLGLARAHLAGGDYRTAADRFAAAALADPTTWPAISGAIRTLAGAGKPDRALDIANQLQQRIPGAAQAWALAGDVHLSVGDYDEALMAYRSAADRSADRILAIKTYIAARESGADQPTRSLDEWLAANPGDERIRRVLNSARRDPS